jgi:hypothetical protein
MRLYTSTTCIPTVIREVPLGLGVRSLSLEEKDVSKPFISNTTYLLRAHLPV